MEKGTDYRKDTGSSRQRPGQGGETEEGIRRDLSKDLKC